MNNLKSQLNNNNILNNIKFVDTIAINFISSDKNLNYTTKCLKTNIFAEVEENLYKEYPQYRETNNSFIANGKQILRFKTIEENKIGEGLTITLIIPS